LTKLESISALKTRVIAVLETAFPQFKAFLDRTIDHDLVLDFLNKESRFGGMLVQSYNHDFWIWSYQPYIACFVETIEELVFCIQGFRR
jgi:hypothetical protein